MNIIVFFILAFLIGAIPFGYIFTKTFMGWDIRTIGSGNIGATNVLRSGHKGLALLTLLCDIGKGSLAVFLGFMWQLEMAYVAWGMLFAVLGHCFTPFLRGKGGKGVATGIGVVLAFAPVIGGFMILIWALMSLIFRYSSLAALISFALMPLLFLLASYPLSVCFVSLLVAGLVILQHRQNIQRLRAHKEPKIKLK